MKDIMNPITMKTKGKKNLKSVQETERNICTYFPNIGSRPTRCIISNHITRLLMAARWYCHRKSLSLKSSLRTSWPLCPNITTLMIMKIFLQDSSFMKYSLLSEMNLKSSLRKYIITPKKLNNQQKIIREEIDGVNFIILQSIVVKIFFLSFSVSSGSGRQEKLKSKPQ